MLPVKGSILGHIGDGVGGEVTILREKAGASVVAASVVGGSVLVGGSV
jgi:hypothetical protein